MRIEIWSDVVCPWCYIGKRRLESALAGFAHADRVKITWRSFQLDPSAPRERTGTTEEQLARKYWVSVEEAREMLARMRAEASELGLDLRFDRARGGNTRDAHRLLHLARDQGLQSELKERLLQAHFTEGEPIGDPEVLARLAADVGLPAGETREVLDSDRYADDVADDQDEALQYGAGGVPFFLIDRRFPIPGAQSVETFGLVLEQAWQRHHAGVA